MDRGSNWKITGPDKGSILRKKILVRTRVQIEEKKNFLVRTKVQIEEKKLLVRARVQTD